MEMIDIIKKAEEVARNRASLGSEFELIKSSVTSSKIKLTFSNTLVSWTFECAKSVIEDILVGEGMEG